MKRILSLVLISFSSALLASPVYEVIDANGHKTYTDKAPINNPLEAKQIDLEPINISQPARTTPVKQEKTYFDQQEEIEKAKQDIIDQHDKKLRQALEAVEKAENNLAQTKEVKGGDYFNNKNGGIRYKVEHLERIDKAEKQLHDAKQAYQAMLQAEKPQPEAIDDSDNAVPQ